jgi:hypothetical protein
MKKTDIIATARARMKSAQDADKDNRARAHDDLQQLTGKAQWPEAVREEREAAGRPCLTINRLPQFVRQVTGDIRRMNPAIKVSPSDNSATEETAEIYEGLIRHIEQRSDASSVYEQTAESAAACSMGAFRVRTDWEREDSFDQEIRIERIRDPFSVYFDPAAEQPTREDSDFAFVTEQMSVEDFKKAYPKASANDADHDGSTDGLEEWREGGRVVVAEYYWKEPKTRTLILLQDGSSGFEDEARQPIPPEFIVRKRQVETSQVKWAKISGTEILEGPTDIPCKYIPVVAVTGEEWHLGNEVYRSSVIRHAKDPQQLYNFFRSAGAEIATLQPKAPYIGTLRQFQGVEAQWANANTANYAFLPYNPDDKAPGPPQRQQPPVASQAMTQEAMSASEDMKATTGIYDAALGGRSNETSGVAIRQRQMESDVSTSIYTDNMGKAIAQCGRILISMIPKVYDTYRVIRILGDDDQEQQVEINGVSVEGGAEVPVNDLTIGSYDLRVSVGPNYSTRRQETQEGMLEFIRSVPQAAQLIGDLVAKAMDWPDADKISDRLAKALPPGLKDEGEPTPEMQQAQMQAQQQQQIQAQMQQQAQAIEMQKAQAEGREAEADAEKAALEVQEQQLDLLMKSGRLDAAVAALVQAQLAQALAGGVPPQRTPNGY